MRTSSSLVVSALTSSVDDWLRKVRNSGVVRPVVAF